MILSLFLIILAYLMGSICSAVIVAKTFSLPDPRTEGSKNPGATNVLRLSGKKYAVLVLVTDLLKGTIPVLIAQLLDAEPSIIALTALSAVIGHMYPIFFDFKGGKGVATAIGALLGFQFVVGVMVAGTWLLVAKFSRYSSLASIVSICLAPFYSLLIIGRMDIFPPIFFMAVLILIKHRHNISRLMDGTEPKVQFKKESVLEEVMDEEPSGIIPMPVQKKVVVEKPVRVDDTVETPVKKEKAPTAKAKPAAAKTTTAKKPVVKKATNKTTQSSEKKPAAKKPKSTKPKTE